MPNITFKKETVPAVVTESVHIELSKEEAILLMHLCGQIGGSPKGVREVTDNIYFKISRKYFHNQFDKQMSSGPKFIGTLSVVEEGKQ